MISLFQKEYRYRNSNEAIIKRSYMKNAYLSMLLLLCFSLLLPFLSYLYFSNSFMMFYDYSIFAVILYLAYLYHAVKAFRIKTRNFETNSIILLFNMNWLDDYIPTGSSCEKSFCEVVKEKKIILETQLILRGEDYER